MKLHLIPMIICILAFASSANSSCFGGYYNNPDRQPSNQVEIRVTDQDGLYRVEVLKKTYHFGVKLKSMTLIQKEPYFKTVPILYSSSPIDEAVIEGKGFAPNRTINKDNLQSYITFTVRNPSDINNFEVEILYGWADSCGSAFKEQPVAKLQYNKALKAQPSAAGTPQSGAP